MFFCILYSRGSLTSGSTQVTQVGEYYSLTLATASIDFATDPTSGESPEQNYHQRAHEKFTQLLVKNKKSIEEKVAQLMLKFKAMNFVPYDAKFPLIYDFLLGKSDIQKGPVRITFYIHFPDEGNLVLAFASAPQRQNVDALRDEINIMFK
jgi:hypothetical protein